MPSWISSLDRTAAVAVLKQRDSPARSGMCLAYLFSVGYRVLSDDGTTMAPLQLGSCHWIGSAQLQCIAQVRFGSWKQVPTALRGGHIPSFLPSLIDQSIY